MRYLSILILLSGLWACSTKYRNLDTDDGTMSEAEMLMKDEFYEEARKQFIRIKTEFPESPLQAQADLRIADSYFEEESFQVSARSYEDFIKAYPTRTEKPYALYKMAKSYSNQMPSNPQRDTRNTQRAVDTFTRLLVDFPDSEYAQESLSSIDHAQDQLAQKSYEIARFYEKMDNYESAALRYSQVVELYADHRLVEECLARQIRMLRKAGQNDNADELTKTFQESYPASRFSSMIQP